MKKIMNSFSDAATFIKRIFFKEKGSAAKLHEKWEFKGERKRVHENDGDTMIEVLLNTCDKMGNAPAYADARSGILSFSKVKLATCMLAEPIQHLPGKYIGVLLPASAGAFLIAFAIQLAGKIPVMINWTIGPKHLEAVKELSHIEAILTSSAFLEKINMVDISPIKDELIMMENVRKEFSFLEKIKGLYRSKKSAKSLMKIFGSSQLKKEDDAVLLFTSGSEAVPKGVPLSHDNILSLHRSGLSNFPFFSDDVMFAFLPPFHSFGFCLTGTIGLFTGIRTAFYPNPTDFKGLAESFETWGATLVFGPPTFIRSLLKTSTPNQLNTMRQCVIGAEKAPQDLKELFKKIGKENALLEGYGITECASAVTFNIPDEPHKGVGKPLPGIELLIVHPETLEPLPIGTEGLLLIGGPTVFRGYINPGITSPFLTVDGKEWYNSGDLGHLDPEGYFYITGRKKRFIKAAGEMIGLEALETVLMEAAPSKGWKLIEEGPILAVIGKEYPGSLPILALVVTFETDVIEVNEILRSEGYVNLIRIKEVIKIEKVPLMGSGKINYRILEETYFKA